MSDPELIQAAIEASGLSARRFAHVVGFGRDERTIRRWRDGSVAITPPVRERLKWFVALPPNAQSLIVALLDDCA